MDYTPIKQKKTEGKVRKLIGQKFGKLTVLDVLGTGKHGEIWVRCQCDCGNVDDYPKTVLTRKIKTTQCAKCGGRQSGSSKAESLLEKGKSHIGETHGELTIIDVVKDPERKDLIAKCKCSCGKDTTSRLSAVLSGKVTSCGHETLKNLTNKEFAVSGTLLTAIDGRRKTNRNSSTGHTGVTLTKRGYRAYISFKRKMYDLGTYKTLDEAVEARKVAEEELYGKFLDELPEEIIDKLKNTKKGRKS